MGAKNGTQIRFTPKIRGAFSKNVKKLLKKEDFPPKKRGEKKRDQNPNGTQPIPKNPGLKK